VSQNKVNLFFEETRNDSNKKRKNNKEKDRQKHNTYMSNCNIFFPLEIQIMDCVTISSTCYVLGVFKKFG